MRVLVTGGTGFVGGWTAKRIADAGHDVRFLVRNPARLETSVAQLGVDTSDYVVGDIGDAESTAAAIDGCDAVVHSAAMVSMDPRDADVMLRTNLDGARNIVGAAVERGLDPVVHVSSFTALFRPGLDVLRADLPVVGGTDAYGRSKAKVESYVRGLQDDGAPVVVSYPGMVLGPPVGDQFGEAADGVQAALEMRGVPGRGAAWLVVDVRDLADLHVALLTKGSGPRRYMAGGKRIPIADLATLIGDAADQRLYVYPVPDTVLRAVGSIVDRVGRFLPFQTPITAAAMQYYTQMPLSDDSPSERDLGIGYRDVRETLADTFAGLRRVGRV